MTALFQGSASVPSSLGLLFLRIFQVWELTLSRNKAPEAPEVKTALVEAPLTSRLHRKEGPCALRFAEKILGKSVRKI